MPSGNNLGPWDGALRDMRQMRISIRGAAMNNYAGSSACMDPNRNSRIADSGSVPFDNRAYPPIRYYSPGL